MTRVKMAGVMMIAAIGFCTMPASAQDADEVAEVVEKFQPDVIGLSLRNIDNVDSVQLESYTSVHSELVGRLRSLTDSPVVLGGSGYSLFPEELLEEARADYGVVGEGESVMT